MSRLTAHAARHRTDLVFPLTEVRDAQGRVVEAEGLGSYRRFPSPSKWFRKWWAMARERRSRRSSSRRWLTGVRLTGVLFAVGTALLGGATGLFPVMLDDATTHGWAAAGQAWTDWLTLVFLGAGAGVLGLAARRWLAHIRRLAERGTAYIIEEQAIHWLYEEKAALLAKISEEFPSMLRVPGPEVLGERWRWQADAASAPLWNARTDELVRSFWAVHYNDEHTSQHGMFIWTPWPVAMAFGARATAGRRGLVLNVRQRPSYGAAGIRRKLELEDGAHAFQRGRDLRPLSATAPQHSLMQRTGIMTVAIESLSMTNTTSPPTTDAQAGENSRGEPQPADPAADPAPGFLLLLVRFVRQDIGPIPLDTDRADDITVHVSPNLADSVIPEGKRDIAVAEWRLTADDGSQVPWPAFPAVGERIADWVEQQAAAHPGSVVLLATRMPQEMGVGLGIQLGQRSATWPQRLYPVYYTGEHLVVPDLTLGRDSVPAQRR